jgi:hypothetical protein
MPKKKSGKKKDEQKAEEENKVVEDDEEEDDQEQKSKLDMESAKGLDSVTDVVEDSQLDADKMQQALTTLGQVDKEAEAEKAAR